MIKGKRKIVAVVLVLLLVAAVFSSQRNTIGEKTYKQFLAISAPEGIEYDIRFSKGDRLGPFSPTSDGVTVYLKTVTAMSFATFEQKLYGSLSQDFEVPAAPEHKTAKMVSIDSSNKNFCSFTGRYYREYPGNYPYEKLGYSVDESCPLLKPYAKLSAGWAFEQKQSSKIPECQSLTVVINSVHTSFNMKEFPANGLFWANVRCNNQPISKITSYSIIDEACRNDSFCN